MGPFSPRISSKQWSTTQAVKQPPYTNSQKSQCKKRQLYAWSPIQIPAVVGAVAGTALSLHSSAAEPWVPRHGPSHSHTALLWMSEPWAGTKATTQNGNLLCSLTPLLWRSVSSKDAPGNKISQFSGESLLHNLSCCPLAVLTSLLSARPSVC